MSIKCCNQTRVVSIFNKSWIESIIENSNNLNDLSKQYLVIKNYNCLLITHLTDVNSIPCRLQAIMFFCNNRLKNCLLVRHTSCMYVSFRINVFDKCTLKSIIFELQCQGRPDDKKWKCYTTATYRLIGIFYRSFWELPLSTTYNTPLLSLSLNSVYFVLSSVPLVNGEGAG